MSANIHRATLALQRSQATTIDLNDIELHQHAFNALNTAAWHIARGEHAKALARIRRAEAHIKASCHEHGAPA